MRKKRTLLGILLLSIIMISGCSGGEIKNASSGATTQVSVSEKDETEDSDTSEDNAADNSEAVTSSENAEILQDGVYTVDFNTDSSMFHINETCDGKGTLTVENGVMTVHITLASKKITNLYLGLAEDASKDGAKLLEPTIDTVTYSDGATEDVYGFDVPVPYLNNEFDLALIGTKGKWYDHKVSVSNPEPASGEGDESAHTYAFSDLEDGNYTIELTFEGGSGKASISSPTAIKVSEGTVTATIEWSSPNYDYMLVNDEKYLPVNTDGNSTFEIPVQFFDKPMTVIGDTVAMSKPHEIEYNIIFHSDTLTESE